jgi:hypothetical protein
MVGVINRSDKENIMSKRFYPKARRVNVLVTTSEMKQENFMGEWKLKMLNLTGFIPADISTEFVGGSNGDNRITFARSKMVPMNKAHLELHNIPAGTPADFERWARLRGES